MKTQKCCSVSRKFSFVSMISLTSSFFLVEIIVGYVTNSMALVADSFHMLSDVVSLLVGYCALRLSAVQQTGSRYTFGWARAEVLGALVNAVFLIALCFSILVEALKRIVMPEHLGDAYLVLITGGIGLFVNIIGLFLFHEHGHGHSHGGGHGHSHGGGHGHSHGDGHGHSHGDGHGHSHGDGHGHSHGHTEDDDDDIYDRCSNHDEDNSIEDIAAENGDLLSLTEHEDKNEKIIAKKTKKKKKKAGNSSSQLNMRAVYLHVLGDALGSVIVVISALMVIYGKGDWTRYVDPSLSIIMVLIILKTSFPLFKESATILMQTVPPHIDIEQIRSRLLKHIPNVRSIHEFHVWQLSGNRIIASVHVRCTSLNEYMKMAEQLKEFFHHEGIHSTTIQPEYVVETTPIKTSRWKPDLADPCILECAKDCSEKQCCRNPDEVPDTESPESSSTGGSQRSSKNEIESVVESIESGFDTQEDSSQLEVNGSDISLPRDDEHDPDRRDSGHPVTELSCKGSEHSISETVVVDVKLSMESDCLSSSGYDGSQEIEVIA